MYRSHKLIMIVSFVLVALASYKMKLQLSESLIQNLVTFLSVAFGFYVTAIAVLYGAGVTKQLYAQIDPKESTRRMLHTVLNYFKVSITGSILTISLILLYSLIASKTVDGYLVAKFLVCDRDLAALFPGLIIAAVAANIIAMLFALNIFIKGLLHEASMKPGNQP